MTYFLNESPGPRLHIDKKEFLYFGGTTYLGLQTSKPFQELLISNIRNLGTNWGASRKSNVRLSIFDVFEEYLSQQSGSEDSLGVSSGYMAGQLLARFFSEKNYELFCAPNTHPALIHERSHLFADYSDLKNSIKAHLESNDSRQIILFIDTIDFSGLNYPEFQKLQQLPLEEIILVADDSHGFGLIGDNGFGMYSMLKNFPGKELILCGSLGKALATPCGVILGEKERISELRTMDIFAGASPPSPAALKTLMDAEDICNEKRGALRSNIQLFADAVTPELDIISMINHPVFGYNNEELTEYLYQRGIITTNFPYPTKTSPLVSKIVLSAHHSPEDILKLSREINAFFEMQV